MITLCNLMLLLCAPFVVYQEQVSAKPNSLKVCVTGKVVKPLDLTFKEGLMLTDAIEEAGGILPGSKISRVLVFRSGLGSDGEMLDIDLKAIQKKTKPDVRLQAFDVVEVLSRKREKEQKPFVNPCPWVPTFGRL